MARHLTKYRRFALDTNYVEAAAGGASSATNSSGQVNAPVGSGGSSGVPGASGPGGLLSSGASVGGPTDSGSGPGAIAGTRLSTRKCNKTYVSSIKSFC